MLLKYCYKYFCNNNKKYIKKKDKDTIFAIASGLGKSAIAILRISGDNSKNIIGLLTKNQEEYDLLQNYNNKNKADISFKIPSKLKLKPRQIYNKTFYNPFNKYSIIDKGISKILAPSSLMGRLCAKTLYLPNNNSMTSELPSRTRSVVILVVSSTKYSSICL